MTQTWPTAGYSLPLAATWTGNFSDAMHRITRFTGNTNTGVTTVQRPNSSGVNTTVTTDPYGHVTSIVTDGRTWTYSYSAGATSATETITDPAGHVTTVVSDLTVGLPTSVTDPLTHTTSYSYYGPTNPAPYQLKSTTMPEGNSVQYVYDSRGNLTQTTAIAKSGSGLANIVTSAVYPTTCTNTLTCNEPTSTTDARLNVTNYTYDPSSGGVATVTSPAVGGISPQTRYTYTALQAYSKNSSGSIVASGVLVFKLTGTSVCRTTASCIGAADETKTTLSYGPQTAGTANNLQLVSNTVAAGDGSLTATSSVAYDMLGNVATSTDPLSHVTAYFFDADREALGAISPDPDGAGALKMRATRITYNADGLITLTEQGTATANTLAAFNAMTTLQQVATAYDTSDRKTQDSTQAGGTTYTVVQYSYDADGRLQCSAQRMNPTVFASLPTSACTLGTAGSYGPDRITYNTYDNADHLLMVTTGYGVTTANGFPATLQRNEEAVTYSNNGKVKTLADAKNNLTTYVYDGFDRLSQTQYPSKTTPGSSNAADYEQLGYDPNGNVTSQRLRDGNNVGYIFDVLNRETQRTSPHITTGSDPTLTFAYNLLGNLTGANDENGDNQSVTYDALGRMTSQTSAHGGTKTMQYDLAGRRTRLTWQDSFYVNYDYDNVNEMTAIHENGAAANLVGFSYDDLGRRTSKTYANGTSTGYVYDAVSRLTSLAINGSTYPNTITLSNYNPAGEIGSHAQSNDAFAYTLSTNGSTSYTPNGLNQYGAIGSTTQTYDARGNTTLGYGVVTYAYNSRNLAVSETGGLGNETANYNPLGRLDSLTEEALWRDYDASDLITELNWSDGSIARRYVFGPGTDEPLVWYEGSGTTDKRFLDADERGTVIRGTTATGAASFNNLYDEYGGGSILNTGTFSFTGQAGAGGLGLIDFKGRMYMPSTGRFMQTDPIGYGDGPNWYNYVHSDPINFIDPAGLKCAETTVGDSPPTITCNNGGTGDEGTVGAPSSGPNGGTHVTSPQKTNTKTCAGSARGLAGNTRLYGKMGAFATVEPNTAAIIPYQFGGSRKADLRPYVGSISGRLTGVVGGRTVTSTFNSITDVIDGGSPIPGVPVRDALQQLFPGQLIVEVTGGADVGPNASIVLNNYPASKPCPTGTTAQ